MTAPMPLRLGWSPVGQAHAQAWRVPGWLPSESRCSRGHRSSLGQERHWRERRIRKSRQDAPRREARQRPRVSRREPSIAWVAPQGDPVPTGLHPPRGRAHWQTPGAQPDETSGKRTEKLKTPGPPRRPDCRQDDFPRASLGPPPALNPKTRACGTKCGKERMLWFHGGTRGRLSHRALSPPRPPPPWPESPWEDQPAPPRCSGVPLQEGVGRGGLREPPGSEVPGFSVPVDGNPRNTDSQVGSVWSIKAARKMCCEHWLWAQLRPAPGSGHSRKGLAGNRRHEHCPSPQRGLAAARHCLSTTMFP